MTFAAMLIVLSAAAPQSPGGAPQSQGIAPQSPGTAPIRESVSVEVRVTDRSGKPLTSAHVKIERPTKREGETNASGRITFRNMRAGTYMLRVEHDAFITLEKEFSVRPGKPASVIASLSPAASGIPVAAAPERPVRVMAGSPRALSIPDLAEKQLIGKKSVKESPIGCSGAADARLIQVREPLTAHTHSDADEMLYVVAGEGSLKLGGGEQRMSPGWFSIVPRGTVHSMSRLGRNPVILLSLLSGPPCSQTMALR